MDSLTTNTPAPTVSTEATQPVQQAQPDKSARFKEKAENQASKVMAEIEKLQKLSNKKYYTYSTEQIGLSTLFQTNFFRLFFRYCTGV